jgi:hypothetical protein
MYPHIPPTLRAGYDVYTHISKKAEGLRICMPLTLLKNNEFKAHKKKSTIVYNLGLGSAFP